MSNLLNLYVMKIFSWMICCFLLLFFVFPVRSEQYKITVNTFLNVRSGPGVAYAVVGTLPHGAVVTGDKQVGEWVKIDYNGKTGYIKSAYTEIIQTPEQQIAQSPFTDIDNLHFLLYVMLALSGIIFIIRRIRGESPLTDTQFFIHLVLFFILCVLELYYFGWLKAGIWFCKPGEVGWVWTVINFLIFGAVVYNQIKAYFNGLEDIIYHSNYVDYRIGLYSYAGAIVAGLICTFFFPLLVKVVIIALVLAQLIQVFLILKENTTCWRYGILNVFYYLIGTVATLVILIHFVMLLLIVLIVLFLLSLFGESGGRCCRNCRSYDGSYCYYRRCSMSSSSYCSKHTYR